MNPIPTLAEQKLRSFVGEQNFQKGQQLVRDGAIIHPEQQAMALKAYCYGLLPEPYRVQVTFDGTGITAALCSCSTGTPLFRHASHEWDAVYGISSETDRLKKEDFVRLQQERLLC